MKKQLITGLIGLVLLIGGLGLLITIVRERDSSVVAAPMASSGTASLNSKTAPANAIKGNPVRLQIPALGMDLQIIPGYYNVKTGAWTLTTDKVQYATITPEPNNQSGNTFFYGHYRKEVFANLHKIPAGAEAIVTTDNGNIFYYKLAKVTVVSPNDSAAVFNYQGSPELTIQTCTGLFFQNRQLFTFKFEHVTVKGKS